MPRAGEARTAFEDRLTARCKVKQRLHGIPHVGLQDSTPYPLQGSDAVAGRTIQKKPPPLEREVHLRNIK